MKHHNQRCLPWHRHQSLPVPHQNEKGMSPGWNKHYFFRSKEEMCVTRQLHWLCQLLHSRKTKFPKSSNEIEAVEGHLEGAKVQERCWLENSMKIIEKGDLKKNDTIAWSACHASLQYPSGDICLQMGIVVLC